MRLAVLEPVLLAFIQPGRHSRGAEWAVAQGVMFLCPKCYVENGSRIGVHSVICWFKDRGVPADEPPLPGRWNVAGASLADLTLSPSVHLSGPGCGWHGFVRNGEVTP